MSDTKTALTGPQKVAVVLMNLDAPVAASVMSQFTESEAADIAAEIVRMRRVDADIAESTLAEFNAMVATGRLSSRGGSDFATDLLELSFGAERAAGVMNRVASNMAGKAFEFLDSAEPGQIATLLDGEMAQTIALVVAHLRPAHASQVLSGLQEDVRTDVAQCIATMGSATPESIALVAGSLKSRAAAVVAPQTALEVVGGVQPLVDIINRADVAMERALLEGLDARDPELAEEIRSRLLTFADIVKLEARDVQNVLRGIDMAVLAVAMKGSADAVQQKIRENLSERNREMLSDELDSMGPARKSQIEEARAAVVRAIRELEQSGTITVHRSEEDAFVE